MSKKKILKIISFISIGTIILLSIYYLTLYYENKKEQKLIYEFFNTTINNSSYQKTNNDNYIGILEIPTINLRKGFYNINNKNNNVNKNIQVLKNSSMPDQENSLLAIAGHSGNGRKSFFNNLDKLNINDEIIIYYNDNEYFYKINNIYEEDKDGTIEIKKDNYSKLVLTTCNQKDKTKQIIIEAFLI